MKIVDIRPKGFCKGVMRAIILAKKTRLENPNDKITLLGQIVHNRFVSEALKQLRIETIDIPGKTRLELLDYVQEGIVVLSAHGSAKQVTKKAKDKGLIVVDASCEDVIKTHIVVETAIQQHKQVIYIGKYNHPESQAICENYPTVYFLEKINEVEKISLNPNLPIIITNQTTLSTLEIRNIVLKIMDKYPDAEFVNEICSATTLRQEAIMKTENVDVLVVVGDPHSNNTNMLAKIGENHGINRIYRIESIEELDTNWFNNDDVVGITAGASTPSYLTKMIIDYLRQLDVAHPHPKPRIDISAILD